MQESNDNWSIYLSNRITLEHFPLLNMVAVQTQHSAAYYWSGNNRKDHEHYIVQFTLKGKGFFEKHGARTEIPEGHGMICFSHDETVSYGYPEHGREPWQFLFIDFQGGGGMVDQIIQDYGHVFSFNPNSDVFQRMRNLRFRKQTSMGFAETSSLITAAIASIAEAEEGIKTTLRYNRTITKALEMIDNNLEQGLYIKELAVTLQITPEHLSRLFRQTTGSTLLEYIKRRRMTYAARLLTSNHESVKQIAARMGYSTSANFARAFKQVYGLAPAAFREA